jgi:filamentous hemagglutinin
MWKINEAFLDQQITQGKEFLFTANPAKATVGSFTNLELVHLQQSGYTIVPASGGLYRAIKK